jgi:nitroreductase
MKLDETVKGRRSIRKYQERDIPDPVIKELLDLARYAPSSMNGQPWYFIVVRDEGTKHRLADIKDTYCPVEKQMFKADMLRNAPVVLVICVDHQRSYDRGIENGVLATANILLAAYSRGLGSVYMSAYKSDEPEVSDEIRQTLGIPQEVDPITIVPLGYPDETPGPKTLGSLDDIVSYEKYDRE